MTNIKGQIEYDLTIDPKGQNHSLQADGTMENSIVSLLIVEQMFAIQIEMWVKSEPKNSMEEKIRRKKIKDMNNSLKGIKELTNACLYNYHDFKNHEAEYNQKREEALKEEGVIPKTFSDLSTNKEN